jgi:hypothetical protein
LTFLRKAEKKLEEVELIVLLCAAVGVYNQNRDPAFEMHGLIGRRDDKLAISFLPRTSSSGSNKPGSSCRINPWNRIQF